MKKLLLLAAFIISAFAFNYSSAQVRFGLHINVGLPGWISGGYNQADYYYLPEIDAYYYVPQRQFIYMDDGNWVFSAGLPSWCGDYDLYRGSKVPVYESRPYLHADRYREKYAGQYRSEYAYHQPQHRAIAMDNRYAVNNGVGYGRGGREDFRHETENRYNDKVRNDTRIYDRGRNENYNNRGREEGNNRVREEGNNRVSKENYNREREWKH
jgi:hypothetical protein